MKKLYGTAIFILCISVLSFSETVITKSGKTYTGKIIDENENGNISILIEINKDDIQSISESDTAAFSRPVKKIPAKPGNFEVISGSAVPTPIDTSRLRTALYKALNKHGYKILSDEQGVITYQLWKRDFDCTVKFCYCENEYWYEYVESRNLDANPAKDKIHKNYRRWIGILEKELAFLY